MTAIFVANDQMALGVLRALHERGREIPREVSIVGFDDIPEAQYFTPPLTTVRQDFSEMGRSSLRLLLELMQDTGQPPQRVTIAPGARRAPQHRAAAQALSSRRRRPRVARVRGRRRTSVLPPPEGGKPTFGARHPRPGRRTSVLPPPEGGRPTFGHHVRARAPRADRVLARRCREGPILRALCGKAATVGGGESSNRE